MLSEEDQKLVEQFALGEEFVDAKFDRAQFEERMLADPELALAVASEVKRLELLNATLACELANSLQVQTTNHSSSSFTRNRYQAAFVAGAAVILLAFGLSTWQSSSPRNQSDDLEVVADFWATLESESPNDNSAAFASEFDLLGESLAELEEDEGSIDEEDFSSDWMSLVAENYFES